MDETNELSRREFLANLGTMIAGVGVEKTGLSKVLAPWLEQGGKKPGEFYFWEFDQEKRRSFYKDAFSPMVDRLKLESDPAQETILRPDISLPMEELRGKFGLAQMPPDERFLKTLELLSVNENERYHWERDDFFVWACAIYGGDIVHMVAGNKLPHRVDKENRPVLEGGEELGAKALQGWLAKEGSRYGWQDLTGESWWEKMKLLLGTDSLLVQVMNYKGEPFGHTRIYSRMAVPFPEKWQRMGYRGRVWVPVLTQATYDIFLATSSSIYSWQTALGLKKGDSYSFYGYELEDIYYGLLPIPPVVKGQIKPELTR